jgi:ParB-like chromosome segregation protein Spo0J
VTKRLLFNPGEAAMEIQLIECDKIEFPTANKDLRTFHMKVARGRAESIKEQRMYHPIAVRANPGKPGYYLGVQGKHRHYAKGAILKEPLIECNVLEMGDEEAEMAAIAENLFRHGLSQPQRTMAVKRWRESFLAKHPELVGKGKAGGAAMKKKARGRREAKINLSLASGVDTREGRAEAKGVRDENALSFTKMLAAATDVSEATAKREQRLAANLTDEQLVVCEQMELTKGQMESIANIKDETQRAEVVDLIAAAVEFDDAWRQVNPDAKKATGKSREREAAEAAAEREEQPVLSDDEWFEQSCGEKAAMLADPAKFKADALIFRRVTEPRHLFRVAVKRVLKDAKAAKVIGPFYHAMNRVVSVSHPRDWFLCGGCRAKGVGEDGGPCKTCHGACYQVRTEVYL